MLFAHFALRPTLKQTLEPPVRIQVALGVFGHFFPCVWVCVAVLWVTGGWVSIVVLDGNLGAHVITMIGTAAIMTLVFACLYLIPYGRMRLAMGKESCGQASAELRADPTTHGLQPGARDPDSGHGRVGALGHACPTGDASLRGLSP